MNREEIENKKMRRIFFVGSARGVNRFYVTNTFMEKFQNAKVINTGVLINNLCKEMGFESQDKITIMDYYRFIEPVLITKILSHLEHTDIILDTHFYWLIPCISVKGLKKIADVISKVVLVLVEEDPTEIYQQKKGRGDIWFDVFDNISDDIFFNRVYFNFYKAFFERNASESSLIYDIDKNIIKDIDDFVVNSGELIKKNGS